MKNPLLEIGLEHYVIILMWIPLIFQDVVLKQSKVFKCLLVVGFFPAWLAIIGQVGLNIEYMFLNGESSNCSKFWWCLSPTVVFNILHLGLVIFLFCAARAIVSKRLIETSKIN